MAEMIKINSLIPPTWNRLKVNEYEITLPEKAGSGKPSFESADDKNPCVITEGALTEEFKNIETGCGDELKKYLEKTGVRAVFVNPPSDKLIRIGYYLDRDSADVICIEAKEGQTVNILTDFSSEDYPGTSSVIQLLIRAGRNSKVNLSQIIRPGKECDLVNDIGADLADGAQINLSQIFVCGKGIGSGFRCDLRGEKSEVHVKAGLVRSAGESLDMNYVMKHHGIQTVSDIDVKGSLSKDARKTFRGTIDFIRGCAGSKGAESENILIMDETAVNKTVPLILCTEENVAGSHGASIGRPADDQLFYMMSRGIGREEAIRILERASLQSAVSIVEDETAKEKMLSAIDELYAG